MRVSVIIPTYNRAGYLREALDSIFAQTLPPWEVIVVDDGSSDDTAQVVNNAPWPIRFYQQTHQGVAVARNLGLANAGGDLIAWLDSDDLWEPEFLETVVQLLVQETKLDGVYTGIIMIDANGAELRKVSRVESPDGLYQALVGNCFLATPAIVVKKTCYDQVGGFDPQFHISEDYDMWLRLASRCRIMGLPHPLVRIRIHANNTMSDIDVLVKARMALTKKHFGDLCYDNTVSHSSQAAYGYAFRAIAFKYIESGKLAQGWAYLEKAVTLHPAILMQLDTFYELALGDQPRGYRGEARQVDINANGVELLRHMDTLFTATEPDAQALKRQAYGNAYLALAMLSDQAGDWRAARRYLLMAIRHYPNLMSPSIIRRMVKLCLGPSVTSWLKSVSGIGAAQRL